MPDAYDDFYHGLGPDRGAGTKHKRVDVYHHYVSSSDEEDDTMAADKDHFAAPAPLKMEEDRDDLFLSNLAFIVAGIIAIPLALFMWLHS